MGCTNEIKRRKTYAHTRRLAELCSQIDGCPHVIYREKEGVYGHCQEQEYGEGKGEYVETVFKH